MTTGKVARPLYLSISADGNKLDDLKAIDARFSDWPRAVMVYEQFVCAGGGGPASSERILSLDAIEFTNAIKRLKPRVRKGDVLVADIELGHPYYGPMHASACGDFARWLRDASGPTGLAACAGSGCYGLIKANQTVDGTTVPHARNPQAPMVDMDLAARPIIERDTHVVCELYLTYPSAPDTAARQPTRVRLSEQTAWMRRDLSRAAYLAQGRPVLAFVNPVYRGDHDKTGTPLTAADLKATLREISLVPRASPVLWMHVGKGNSTSTQVINAVGRWTQVWKEMA